MTGLAFQQGGATIGLAFQQGGQVEMDDRNA